MLKAISVIMIIVFIFYYNKKVSSYYNKHSESFDQCPTCKSQGLSDHPRPWWVRLHESIRR